MSTSQNSAGGTPPRESSGGVRNLYLVEILLGAGLLLMVVLIFMANNPSSQHDEPSDTNGNIVTLTAANWQKEVMSSSVPVVVDFWAPWCGPCRQLAPTIERLADRYAGKVKIGKVNVDDAQTLGAQYRIESIPTVLIFAGGGAPRQKIVGLTSEAVLAAEIDRVLEAGGNRQ
jgi:thioredoxin 1